MKINVIITGTTGMVGKGVLLECLDSDHVTSVLVINRHSIGISHPKLKEIIHKDFYDLASIEKELKGYNACYFCLGVSAGGMSADNYYKITHDLTINFAETVLRLNPEIKFIYVSGAGTDSSEKGMMRWARVKGKTENELLKMSFQHSYMFRPAFIQPTRGIKSRTASYNAAYTIVKPFWLLLRKLPKWVTDTDQVGKAMINVTLRGSQTKILENIDISELAKE